MKSALERLAWRELTRRRTRSLLTILAVAAAVTSLWMFAIPQLVNRAMGDRVEEHRLDHVLLSPGRIDLTDDHIERLRAIPNVDGLDVRTGFGAPIAFGDQRQDAVFIGVRDFADQQVNVVTIEDGTAPGFRELLVDPQNARSGRLRAATGDELMLITSTGHSVPLPVTGVGGSLRFSDPVRDGSPVIYVTHETLRQLTGVAGFTELEFRVVDRSDGRLTETLDEVRSLLEDIAPGVEYQTVAAIRPEGDWPGRESMENVTTVFYVLASLAALSALFMVANTMNAIVAERRAEIALMKAVGGRRRQIASVYVKSALIIGGIGTAAGLVAGVLLTNLLLRIVSVSLMTLTPGWGFSWQVALLGIAVGTGGSALASLPSVWRAVRIPVTEAMRDPGISAGYGAGWIDRTLQRPGFLPRITQIGLRNAARRKASSLATGLQVGIGLGIALGLLMLANTVMTAANAWRNAEGGDIEVADGAGIVGFEERIRSVPGVGEVEGVYWSTIGIAERRAGALGLPADTTIFGVDLVDGRWFTEEEEGGLERVAVIGLPLAEITGLEVGDRVPVETPGGREEIEIIGIDRNMSNDGEIVYLPIETHFQLDLRSLPNWYWVRTEQSDEAFIDGVTTGIAGALDAAGYPYHLEVNYIDANAAQAEERLILGVISVIGIPIMLIGMIGLASAMTMSVLQRTREIGILRSIGARARDVRRMIRAEGLTLAALGWLLALPLGFVSGWAMLWVIGRAFHASFGLAPPYWAIGPSLPAALLLAVVIVRRPARRAVRLSPGTALRYE